MNVHRSLTKKHGQSSRLSKCGKRLSAIAFGMLALLTINASSQSLDSLQKHYVSMQYGMFIHFNMATFTRQEWADPNLSPNLFSPDSLNCGQWADAAKAAGMKYMILTAKHHDGFSLWPSAYSTYDVASSSWRGGKGDVVKEFTDSCRSRGLAVGLYFSIWDRTYDGDGAYPEKDGDTTYIKNQLTELLTNYGPIAVLWFDGWGWQIPYESIPYQAIRTLIRSIQPNCLVVNNNHEANLMNTDIVEWEAGGNEDMVPAGNTLPSEVCETIMNEGNWFNPGSVTTSDLHTATFIKDERSLCNSRNANVLLDVTPDVHGKIPSCQVQRLIEAKPAATGTIQEPRGATSVGIQPHRTSAEGIFDLAGRPLVLSHATRGNRIPSGVHVRQVTTSGVATVETGIIP